MAEEKSFVGCGIAAVLLIGGIITFCASTTKVPSGNTGVIITMGKVEEQTLSEGFHFKTPFVQSVKKVSNKIQVYETPASSVSKDLQSVSCSISVALKLSPDYSDDMVRNVGDDWGTILVAPAVQECVKAVTAKFTAEELITRRQEVSDSIKELLDGRLNEYGIFIEKFNIVNFTFSTEFDNAIEQKQVAEQNLLKSQTEQKQAIVVAEAEAKQKQIAAEAEAEVARTKAAGEADAIRMKADAQAEANKKLNESISDKVISYNQIEKWNGTMPNVVVGDDGSGNILFNVPTDKQ